MKLKKKTKYENTVMIMAPNGLVPPGQILTGKQWEDVLVYPIGNSMNTVFKEIKDEINR